MENFRKRGALLVTVPSLQESLDALQVKTHTHTHSSFLELRKVTTSCSSGGVAAWLGGGTSCGLRCLPGPGHRP